jgi:hypothetical protein
VNLLRTAAEREAIASELGYTSAASLLAASDLVVAALPRPPRVPSFAAETIPAPALSVEVAA